MNKFVHWLDARKSMTITNLFLVSNIAILVFSTWMTFSYLTLPWAWTMTAVLLAVDVYSFLDFFGKIGKKHPKYEHLQSWRKDHILRVCCEKDEDGRLKHSMKKVVLLPMAITLYHLLVSAIAAVIGGTIWLVVTAGEWVWDIFLQHRWFETLCASGIVVCITGIAAYVIDRERKLRQLNKALTEADSRHAESKTQAEHFEKKTKDLVHRVEELKCELSAKAREIASYRDQANKQLNERWELNAVCQDQTNRLNAMVYSIETLVRLSFQLRAPHPSTNPRKEVVQKVSHELEILARQHLEADKVDAMLYRLKNPEKAKITTA